MNELKFVEDSHTYWVGKKRLPSVSEIIKPVCNYDGVDEDVLERKSAIGKAAHLLAEWHDRKEKIDAKSIDPAVLPYFKAYKDFVKKMRPKWELIEHRDCSRLGYAGTLDRFGTIPSMPGKWMVDVKTVAQVSPATGIQTAAYAGLRTGAIAPIGIKRAALWLRPDGSWRWHEFTDVADWATFLSLLNLWKWKAKHGL